MCFTWVRGYSNNFPAGHDPILKAYAFCKHSFASYIYLSEAFRKAITDPGALFLPSRMVELTLKLYRNHLKDGVGFIWRYMRKIAQTI